MTISHSKRPTHSFLVCNHGEKISFISIVHDHIDVITLFKYSIHCDNAGVAGCETVEAHFSPLKVLLTLIKTASSHAFDRPVHRLRLS